MQHLASWALESAFRSRWATCERSPSGELGDPRASISSCVKWAQLVLPCGSWREAGRSPQGCGERAQGPAAQSGSARGRDRPRLKHTPRGLGQVLGILLLRGWERRKGGAGASGLQSQFSSQDRNSAARPEGSRPDVATVPPRSAHGAEVLCGVLTGLGPGKTQVSKPAREACAPLTEAAGVCGPCRYQDGWARSDSAPDSSSLEEQHRRLFYDRRRMPETLPPETEGILPGNDALPLPGSSAPSPSGHSATLGVTPGAPASTGSG